VFILFIHTICDLCFVGASAFTFFVLRGDPRRACAETVRAQLSFFFEKKSLALVLNEINFARVCIVFKLTNPTGIGAKIPPGARPC
jgi:hypothetical protein